MQKKVIPKDMVSNILDLNSSRKKRQSNSSKDFKIYDSNERQEGVLININLETSLDKLDVKKEMKNDIL